MSPMTGEIITGRSQFDPLTATRGGGLSLTFERSRAHAYAVAVQICLGAADYQEAGDGKALRHFAYFAPTREDMTRALAALSTLRGYRSLLVYAGGVLQNWARAQRVLQCYVDACACADSRAHCQIMVHRASMEQRPLLSSLSLNPDFETARAQGQAMLFPCRLLAFSFAFKLQAGHPSSEADQIQAGAVREGCSWCPNFNQGGERA